MIYFLMFHISFLLKFHLKIEDYLQWLQIMKRLWWLDRWKAKSRTILISSLNEENMLSWYLGSKRFMFVANDLMIETDISYIFIPNPLSDLYLTLEPIHQRRKNTTNPLEISFPFALFKIDLNLYNHYLK